MLSPCLRFEKAFKIAWLKHHGWPEIIVHDQGPEFMGSEFQNPARAAGFLSMPIDSQSFWQNGKTEKAGQSFKHQLWDLDEECHIEGETEFEAAVAECCDVKNRYCNLSGFSAHQRVFGSSLRLLGSLLSEDPIDRQLLTVDPYTNFHRANESANSSPTSVVQTKFCTCGTSCRIGTSQISAERKHQCRRYDHGVAQQQFELQFTICPRQFPVTNGVCNSCTSCGWTRCESPTRAHTFLPNHSRSTSLSFSFNNPRNRLDPRQRTRTRWHSG